MSDPLLVRSFQCIGDLARDAERFLERHRAFWSIALDVLHHQVVWPDIIEMADIRMVQRSNGAGLPVEAFRELRGRNFDGNVAAESRVAGSVDLPHSSRANRRKNLVRTEL